MFAFEVWRQILAIRIGFPRNQVESICLYLIFTQGLLINTANAGWYRPIMSDMVDKICTVMMPLQMKMKMKLLWYGQLSLCLCACACVLLPLFSCQWYIKLWNVYYIRILEDCKRKEGTIIWRSYYVGKLDNWSYYVGCNIIWRLDLRERDCRDLWKYGILGRMRENVRDCRDFWPT